MIHGLGIETLEAMGTRVAVLSVGLYALPVRFRIRGRTVECRVPTWSGVGDLLDEIGELTLVAFAETGPHLTWLFVRGRATLVSAPLWDELQPLQRGPISPDDLYHLLRIEPRRIERVDERAGWGFRETIDL